MCVSVCLCRCGQLTELQRRDEPWAGERVKGALIDDVKDDVEGIPQEDVHRYLPSWPLLGERSSFPSSCSRLDLSLTKRVGLRQVHSISLMQ